MRAVDEMRSAGSPASNRRVSAAGRAVARVNLCPLARSNGGTSSSIAAFMAVVISASISAALALPPIEQQHGKRERNACAVVHFHASMPLARITAAASGVRRNFDQRLAPAPDLWPSVEMPDGEHGDGLDALRQRPDDVDAGHRHQLGHLLDADLDLLAHQEMPIRPAGPPGP